jgi:hypothetical protein
LSRGLPFASKMPASALGLVASAPRPYTVSVGKATRPPLLMASAASPSAPSSILSGSTRISLVRAPSGRPWPGTSRLPEGPG